MVDREDAIHIRIKIDVDEEDKQFTENLASNLAKTDEEKTIQKIRERVRETPEDEDEMKEKSEKAKKDITENKEGIKDIQKEIELLEEEIVEIQKRLEKGVDPKDPEILKAKLEAKRDRLLLKELNESPVGIVKDFTREQATNLRKFTANPGQFFIAGLGKILGRVGGAAAKGGIFGVLALIIYEISLFVLDEMMKPGRPLDRRFKRIASLEVMNFYERQLQEEIRHGYQEIRVTTRTGLRGGASQVNGNLFEFNSGSTGIIQSSPYRSSQEIYRSESASGVVTDSKGSPRRRKVGSTRYG